MYTVDDASTASTAYTATVTNTGSVAGDEVVLAYVTPNAASLRASLGANVPVEKKRLFGFQRVTLAAGASTTVSFQLGPEELAMVDEDGHRSLHKGLFDVVLSRGHGDELSAPAAVAPVDGGNPIRLETFNKWW